MTIDVRYARTPAEDFALAHAMESRILAIPLRAASPDAMIWLYLLSKRMQNFVDGLTLIRSNPDVDLPRIRHEVTLKMPALLDRLDDMIASAKRPVMSYEESRSRRQ